MNNKLKVGDFVRVKYDRETHVGRIIDIWGAPLGAPIVACAVNIGREGRVHFYVIDVKPIKMSNSEKMLWVLENE